MYRFQSKPCVLFGKERIAAILSFVTFPFDVLYCNINKTKLYLRLIYPRLRHNDQFASNLKCNQYLCYVGIINSIQIWIQIAFKSEFKSELYLLSQRNRGIGYIATLVCQTPTILMFLWLRGLPIKH